MRTKILAITIALTLGVALVGRASNANEKEITNISKYLNNTIKYPSFAEDKGLEGSVSLIVWVDENQKLHFSNIQGNDIRFEKYVETWLKRIENKPIKFSEIDGVKKVKVNFKMIG